MNIFEKAAVTLFCDDIRNEKSEQKTLVGIYGFNFEVIKFPYTFSKLCAYSQFFYNVEMDVTEFSLRIFKDEELLAEAPAPEKFFDGTKKKNIQEGRPYGAVFGSAEFVSLEIDGPCTLYAVAQINGVDYDSGRMKIYEKAKK